ncbi:MAG: PilZ domain-containing protein [Candidatus Methylomirabilales bacterium]
MSDWICRFCGNTVRRRTQRPAYCPRCSMNKFEQTSERPAAFTRSTTELPQASRDPAPSAGLQFRRLRTGTTDPGPHRERRRAQRVQPKEPLEVRLFRQAPLQALNISANGLLVEHSVSFPPGAVCDVELCQAGRTIRLRGQVVRSALTSVGKGPATIRYRTGVQFLQTPESMFAVLPELPGAPESGKS